MPSCCGIELPDGYAFCPACGKRLEKRKTKRRGNGTGSIYKLPNGKWRGAVQIGTYLTEDGKLHRKVSSRNFSTKKEAVEWVASPEARQEKKREMTLKELYDRWSDSYDGSASAVAKYKAAFDKLKPLWVRLLDSLTIDDLQSCISNSNRGRQSQDDMKLVLSQMYKFGIPRHYIPENLNLAQFLKATGSTDDWKEGIPLEYLRKMPDLFDAVPYMEYLYAHCYLGFRPNEFLALDTINYNRKEKVLVGGSKTAAGRNRKVTISPKIQPIIDKLTAGKIAGPIFCDQDGKRIPIHKYRVIFDECLAALGLENPIKEQNGRTYKKYTPHSCRHTFATLLKGVDGPVGDKLAIIGHASEGQLREYEDTSIEDFRKITDAL